MTHDKAMEMARELIEPFGTDTLAATMHPDSDSLENALIDSVSALILRIDTEARQQQREEWHAIYHALCRLERTPEGDDNWLDAYSNLWGEFRTLREKWRPAAIREGGR